MQFVGATDSAAPCAMLLDLAESLTPLLKARHDRVTSQEGILRDGFDEEESSDTTLTILFLDGEEAFHDWTDTDSIYGARHLSQLWQDTYPDHSVLGKRRYDPIPTYIETIDHFILLDLLGNSHSRLHSYYRETDWLFDEMADVDRRLREEGLVEVEEGEDEWFQKLRMRPGMIGDDHLPVCPSFLIVLSFIPVLSFSQVLYRFPQIWLAPADARANISSYTKASRSYM
jgi:glutaminyl-peptide cyclotransferase